MDLKLTSAERLILLNQYEILKALKPDEEQTDSESLGFYDEMIEILRHGYEHFYSELVQGFGEFSDSDSEFVVRVMDLYRRIEWFKRDNSADASVTDVPYGRFAGFDGNNEGGHFSFVQFLLRTRKFEEQLPYRGETDGFNSHSPMIAIYQRMLAAWESEGEPTKLTRANVQTILAIAMDR